MMRFMIASLITWPAAIMDIRLKKIPNLYILPIALTGLISCSVRFGLKGLGLGLLNMMVSLLILIPLNVTGSIGAGDIKLMAAVSLIFTTRESLYFIFLSFLAGAAWSLIRIARRKELIIRIYTLRDYLVECFREGKVKRYKSLGTENDVIPFGVCIFAGTLLLFVTEVW